MLDWGKRKERLTQLARLHGAMEIISTIAITVFVDDLAIFAAVTSAAFNSVVLSVGWCRLFVAPPFEEVEVGGHDGPTLSF